MGTTLVLTLRRMVSTDGPDEPACQLRIQFLEVFADARGRQIAVGPGEVEADVVWSDADCNRQRGIPKGFRHGPKKAREVLPACARGASVRQASPAVGVPDEDWWCFLTQARTVFDENPGV